jgi:hypothetical protein
MVPIIAVKILRVSVRMLWVLGLTLLLAACVPSG